MKKRVEYNFILFFLSFSHKGQNATAQVVNNILQIIISKTYSITMFYNMFFYFDYSK